MTIADATHGETQPFNVAAAKNFNLMALGGDVSNFTDAQGPILASGNVRASGFGLNCGKQLLSALIANGSVDLASGTVCGSISYGTTYNGHGTTTLVDPHDPKDSPPEVAKAPDLLDYGAVSALSTGMSNQLNAYFPIRAAQRLYQAVTFGGPNLDQELNVFSLDSSDLTNTTSFVFDVPKGSFVIINVSGTTPVFASAGFSGPNGAPMPTANSRLRSTGCLARGTRSAPLCCGPTGFFDAQEKPLRFAFCMYTIRH